MKHLLLKAGMAAGAVLMLVQPVLAQEMRPYSQVELQQAYERGRADQARDTRSATTLPRDQPDGYCYQRQASARATGTIVGAVLGGMVGNGLSDRWNRGGNTIGGAMVGGILGSSVGGNSVACYQDAYYAYDDGYYAPPLPPRGYVTVFYSSRPSYGYGHVYRRPYGYGRPYYGHGHRW